MEEEEFVPVKLSLTEMHRMVAEGLDIPQRDLTMAYSSKYYHRLEEECISIDHRDFSNKFFYGATAVFGGIVGGVSQSFDYVAGGAGIMALWTLWDQYSLYRQRKSVLSSIEQIRAEREAPKPASKTP